MTVGAVILAGGHARRMDGADKALLLLDGESFLDRLLRELSGFDELLISTDAPERYAAHRAVLVPDLVPDAGPLGAIASALLVCRSDALVVTACDMPFFSGALAQYLAAQLSEECDALTVSGRDGRRQPLCGVYRKTALPAALALLREKNYRMSALLGRLREQRLPLESAGFPEKCLLNINRPEDYQALLRQE